MPQKTAKKTKAQSDRKGKINRQDLAERIAGLSAILLSARGSLQAMEDENLPFVEVDGVGKYDRGLSEIADYFNKIEGYLRGRKMGVK